MTAELLEAAPEEGAEVTDPGIVLEGAGDAASLMVQVLQAVNGLATSQQKLQAAMVAQVEQGKAHTAEIRKLAEAITLQTAEMSARTGLVKELGGGMIGALQRRWFMLLVGLAMGLGLAGARELLNVVVGQLGTAAG